MTLYRVETEDERIERERLDRIDREAKLADLEALRAEGKTDHGSRRGYRFGDMEYGILMPRDPATAELDC